MVLGQTTENGAGSRPSGRKTSVGTKALTLTFLVGSLWQREVQVQFIEGPVDILLRLKCWVLYGRVTVTTKKKKKQKGRPDGVTY